MSPGILARAAADWTNPPDGHETVNLSSWSRLLAGATDGRFDWFVQQFLEHVIIPEELVRFTRGFYPRQVTPEAADWLRHFRFTGTVKLNPGDPEQVSRGNLLIRISAPLYEVRVIQPPIQMLNKLVSIKFKYWSAVASIASPSQIHHEPIGEWPFERWIDLQVARACGFHDLGHAGAIRPISLISNVRGQVSISGALPKDAEELTLLASAAGFHPRSQSRTLDLEQAIRKK
jgi:hypothetical protein